MPGRTPAGRWPFQAGQDGPDRFILKLMQQYVEQLVDLLDPQSNQIDNMAVAAARERVLCGSAEAVREIEGSFALMARNGKTVRMARSLDRPMRYFLAKREEGPALIVADRIDAIHAWLKSSGLDGQFHPSYTRGGATLGRAFAGLCV